MKTVARGGGAEVPSGEMCLVNVRASSGLDATGLGAESARPPVQDPAQLSFLDEQLSLNLVVYPVRLLREQAETLNALYR